MVTWSPTESVEVSPESGWRALALLPPPENMVMAGGSQDAGFSHPQLKYLKLMVLYESFGAMLDFASPL